MTVPREFVFMDRAAIGLGGVFLHLAAELNFSELFRDAMADFSVEAVAERQAACVGGGWTLGTPDGCVVHARSITRGRRNVGVAEDVAPSVSLEDRSMPFRSLVIPFVAVAALFSAPARAEFVGDLAFKPEGCMTKRDCILTKPLTFTDHARRVWRAEVGTMTDGASIPDWAQSVIGGPWDESYLKAAVLHDYYCGSMTATWRDTHLMFYEALIEQGVSEYKAKLMYYAVYLEGPKWLDVLKVMNCEKKPDGTCARETLMVVDKIARPENYNSAELHQNMVDVENYMKKNPNVSLDEIEAMAERKHPNNSFYARGAGIVDSVAKSLGLR